MCANRLTSAGPCAECCQRVAGIAEVRGIDTVTLAFSRSSAVHSVASATVLSVPT